MISEMNIYKWKEHSKPYYWRSGIVLANCITDASRILEEHGHDPEAIYEMDQIETSQSYHLIDSHWE